MVGNDTSYVVLTKDSPAEPAPKRSLPEPAEIPVRTETLQARVEVDHPVIVKSEEINGLPSECESKEDKLANEKKARVIQLKKKFLKTPEKVEINGGKGILRTPASVNPMKNSEKKGRRSVSFARSPPSHVKSRKSMDPRFSVPSSFNRRKTLPGEFK